MAESERSSVPPQISIVIPARNEEENIGTCLESLVSQAGVSFEIIVVNDHSTDRTREIAQSFSAVRMMEAGPLPAGWTGKNNAVTTGARVAHGEWLLFTDADTFHLPGSLSRALTEAEDNHADLISYSPEQIAVTFWERAVLPVVFAELARQYPPSRVSDPNSPDAAANGQYILVKHAAYDTIGGHASVADSVLEDVALARAVKASGRKIRFRYAADAVRTRMYRNFRQLREGWTKNLALLFRNPLGLAVKTIALWGGLWIVLYFANARAGRYLWNAAFLALFVYLAIRLRRSNFTWDRNVLGVLFGMPMFAYLLLRSKGAYARGNVSWKGRTYEPNDHPMTKASHETTIPTGKLA